MHADNATPSGIGSSQRSSVSTPKCHIVSAPPTRGACGEQQVLQAGRPKPLRKARGRYRSRHTRMTTGTDSNCRRNAAWSRRNGTVGNRRPRAWPSNPHGTPRRGAPSPPRRSVRSQTRKRNGWRFDPEGARPACHRSWRCLGRGSDRRIRRIALVVASPSSSEKTLWCSPADEVRLPALPPISGTPSRRAGPQEREQLQEHVVHVLLNVSVSAARICFYRRHRQRRTSAAWPPASDVVAAPANSSAVRSTGSPDRAPGPPAR